MTCGLVHASYSLPKLQAVKLTFFAPWTFASGLHQVMASIYYARLLLSPWILPVIVSLRALFMVGGFWSKAMLLTMLLYTYLSEMSWAMCDGQWSKWSKTCLVLQSMCEKDEGNGMYDKIIIYLIIVYWHLASSWRLPWPRKLLVWSVTDHSHGFPLKDSSKETAYTSD